MTAKFGYRRIRLLLAAFLGAAILITTACESGRARQSVADERTDLRTVTMPVEGLVCSVCAAGLKSGLKKVSGVAEVEVSLEQRNVRIRYEPDKVTPERLAATVADLGYKPGQPKVQQK